MRWVLAILTLTVLVASCRTRTAPEATDEVKSAFVALDGATAVRWSKNSLIYRVREAYPAVNPISEIDASLRARGWTPRSEDVMNPGNPTSNSEGWKGWGSFIDSTKRPERRVHSWAGQWKNQKGDVVITGLTYTSAGTDLREPQDDHLQVMFKFLPSDVVRQLPAMPRP